jgi:hypothetical protein
MRAERIRSLIATTEQATEQAEAERTRRILEFCRTPRSREEELTEPDKPTSPKQRYKTKDPAL